jgi:hypothetical protein
VRHRNCYTECLRPRSAEVRGPRIKIISIVGKTKDYEDNVYEHRKGPKNIRTDPCRWRDANTLERDRLRHR